MIPAIRRWGISSDGQLSFNFDVTLELVKTSSTVSSGSLSQAQTEFGLGVYNQEGIGSPNTISYSGNVTFNEVTCSVSPKSLTVTLGDFPVSDFTGTGTLTSPQTFDVTVNCNDTVQPEVMVSSANGYETDFPGVIKLTQESGVATGVGYACCSMAKSPTLIPTKYGSHRTSERSAGDSV